MDLSMRFPVTLLLFLCVGLSSLHTSSTDNSVPTSEASISVGDVPVGDQLSESEIANGDQGEQAEVTGDSNQTGEQEVNGNEAEADASTNKPDVIKPTPTGPAGTQTSDGPEFVLRKDGAICLRVAFKATLNIRYYTEGQINTRLLTTGTTLPEDATVTGECGTDVSTLLLAWPENNTLAMNFTREKSTKTSRTKTETVFTWSVTKITYTFSSMNSQFHTPIEPGEHTVETGEGEKHFEAPANFSYKCESEEDILLREYNASGSVVTSALESVGLSIWDAAVQGFNIHPDGEFGPAAVCKPDVEKEMPHQNIAPVAVAACLAAIILVIIVAYFFIKNKEQKKYTGLD